MNIIQSLFGQRKGADIESMIGQGAFLVDVRTPGEFADGHVKGSVNIPLDRIASQLSRFNGRKHIIVYCRSGARSAQAKAILEQNGFANVVNGGSWDYVNRFVK